MYVLYIRFESLQRQRKWYINDILSVRFTYYGVHSNRYESLIMFTQSMSFVGYMRCIRLVRLGIGERRRRELELLVRRVEDGVEALHYERRQYIEHIDRFWKKYARQTMPLMKSRPDPLAVPEFVATR